MSRAQRPQRARRPQRAHRTLLFLASTASVAAFAFLSTAVPAQVAAGVVAYEGARIIHGDGRPPIERGVLVVDGGRIRAVGPTGSVTVPAGARRVDLDGKTIMPAMIDVHVHIGYEGSTPDQARAAVKGMAAKNLKHVKIWVDDRRGTYPKMTPEVYTAIIDEAHSHQMKVHAHATTLADQKAVVRAGIDVLVHTVG